MTDSADRLDLYIEMLLALNGRATPADVTIAEQPDRAPALARYHERHAGARELHFEGEALVVGPAPAPAAAAAVPAPAPPAPPAAPAAAPALAAPAPAAPAPAVDDIDALLGDSAPPDVLDELLGGYAGVDDVEAARQAAEASARLGSPPGLGAAPASATGPRRVAPAAGSVPTPRPPAAGAPPLSTSRLWMLWWVPTVLLPLVGGVMAWLGLRNTRFREARIMLGVGLAIGAIASMVFATYSYQIAAYLTGAGRETVITQPSTTAQDSAP